MLINLMNEFFFQFKELESISNGVTNGEIARIKGIAQT